MLKLSAVLLSGLAVALPLPSCFAGDVDWPGLPPATQVETALAAQPRVREAAAMLDAARARAVALNAGPYEWTARAGLHNRTVNTGPDNRFTEGEVALEKSFRLPGKSALDQRLGQSHIQQGEFAVGDAMHESARELLVSWFDYSRASESAALWQAQNGLLQKQLEIVDKRIRAGDAPRLEREAARAALAQSQSQAARAELQRDSALAALKARYPQLSLSPVAAAEPLRPEGSLDNWREAVLADNHELAYAEAGAQLAGLNAERQAANLKPDPAIGLRYSSERGGEESVLGAYVSLALPGAARRAEGDAARAQAQAARIQAGAVKSRLMLEAESQFLAATRNHESWLNARESADAFQKQADGALRAYQLGEGSLADSLTAQRLALEARLNEAQARADALQAFYRLKLDAHKLWDLHLGE